MPIRPSVLQGKNFLYKIFIENQAFIRVRLKNISLKIWQSECIAATLRPYFQLVG
jgi:hypothetical protein